MQNANYVIIMAGGMGVRFWPLSRTDFPKQFLDILGTGETLIQQSFRRFEGIVPADHIYVVTAQQYIPIVEQQLPRLPKCNIVGEPVRRNTAPCIAYISFKLANISPDAAFIVSPADHHIEDDESFAAVCRNGLDFVSKNPALVTIGIKPFYPSTGYGYIQRAAGSQEPGIFPVRRFIEKPYLELAKTFVQSDDFFWNAGIFIWKIMDILAAFSQYLPDVYAAFDAIREELNTTGEAEKIAAVYKDCPDISIDFGIMEKSDRVYMIPASFDWSDLGTWSSAWQNMGKDEMRNAITGTNVMLIDATQCVIHSSGERLLVLQGLDDFIVADTKDVLLVCRKEKEQDIKLYVAAVQKEIDEKYAYRSL